MSQNIKADENCTAFCFGVLESKLKNNQFPAKNLLPQGDCPMFVTYHKNGNLRGCIGNFSDMHIAEGLAQLALQSAFSDHRFPPMRPSELDSLHCSVSLLINFEDGSNALDWEVGKHGIRIHFDGYGATYLPEVASEQGWTKEETLRTLVQKAGYYGDLNDVLKKIKLTRYQSSKHKMSYNEYLEYKKRMNWK